MIAMIPEKIRTNIRKVATATGLTLLVLLAIAQLGGWMYERDKAKGDTLNDEEYLEYIAEKVTAICPLDLENGIVMRKVHALPGKTLLYDSQVTDHSIEDPVLETLIRMIKEPLIEQISTAPEFSRLRGMEVTIIYEYYDMYNRYITDVVIRPEDYY